MRPHLSGKALHTWVLAGLAVESACEPGAGDSLPFFSVTNFTQVGTFPTGQGTCWNRGRVRAIEHCDHCLTGALLQVRGREMVDMWLQPSYRTDFMAFALVQSLS